MGTSSIAAVRYSLHRPVYDPCYAERSVQHSAIVALGMLRHPVTADVNTNTDVSSGSYADPATQS
jgi:hypothetical protein